MRGAGGGTEEEDQNEHKTGPGTEGGTDPRTQKQPKTGPGAEGGQGGKDNKRAKNAMHLGFLLLVWKSC